MPKITNISKALQGVNTLSGVVYLAPGESRDDLEFSVEEGKHLKTLSSLLHLSGGEAVEQPADVEPEVKVPEAKTPAEVLAMFDDDSVHFQTAKSEAVKLLGADAPSTKDDIIAALKAL